MNAIGLQWIGNDYRVSTQTQKGRQRMMMDSLTERIKVLQAVPLFEGLPDSELRFLAAEVRERLFEADDMLFYQGEGGSNCHIITRGKVRVFVVGEDGRELSVSLLGAGEIVGEMALFENLPRSASVQALEQTHTLELHQEVLMRGLQRSPQLALSLLRALINRLRHTTEDAENLVSLTVADRLMARLWRLAEWAGRPDGAGNVRIAFPMTQQQLAALVGTSRESVNRALSSLRRQDRVCLDDGWIILLQHDV